MIHPLRALFKSKHVTDAAFHESEVKLATAHLMLEVVKADGHIGRIELITMSEILRHQFKLEQEDLNEIFSQISGSRPSEDGLHKITRTICETWGNAKRMKLLENLWVVALSDQTIDQDENTMVRKFAGLLCLNEMQIFQSQENAKLQMGIEDF